MLKIGYRGFNRRRRASGGGVFTPASIANLDLWCDADLGLSGVASGNPISTWIASVGGNPTQTGTNRPTKDTVDGKVCALFAGKSMALAASLNAATDFTVFILAHRSMASILGCFIGSYSAAVPAIQLRENGNCYFANNSRYGSVASSITGWHSFICVSNGTTLSGYIDGIAVTLTTGALSASVGWDALGAVQGNRLVGAVRSFGHYNRALTPTEVSTLSAYLTGL